MQLKKFNHDAIPEIIQELELDDELNAELQQKKSDIDVLNALVEKERFSSAVTYLALGLPKREAVWWSYLCAEQAESASSDLKTQNALKATSQWVRDPSDENREKARPLAEALELYTPASWSAMAVYWSGDSIAPPDKPPVAPAPFMAGHAVANAINLAAGCAENATDQIKIYIKQGIHISMGGNGKIT